MAGLSLVQCAGELRYHLSPNQREMLEKKMSAYCGMPVVAYAESMKQGQRTETPTMQQIM